MINITIVIVILLASINLLYPGNPVNLNLEKIFEIGQKKIFFKSITSVYEDNLENVYILDKKAYKVYKFSKEGELQLAFGNRGQGPGDFLNPHSLFMTSEGNIIVNDIKDFVYLFDKKGKFLSRIKVSKGLDLNLLNSNLFYAWVWTKKGRQQVLLDKNGKILKSFFSVSKKDSAINIPDETGRLVMFNYFTNEYTPFLLFSRFKNHGIIGVTNKYEILLVNQDGKIIGKFFRDIKPGIISPEETEYFKQQINDSHQLPDYVKNRFIRKIPRYKNYFNHILISGSYVWVFRVRDNVLEEESPLKTDLFKIDSKFIGTLAIKSLPLFISEKYIFFEGTSAQEDLLLLKYKYSIK
jgi:hypothetical protein